MRTMLRRLFGKRDAAGNGDHSGRHLTAAKTPAAIYAIGDVHGCLDELLSLERQIVDDSRSIQGEKIIVMLGDYVDRGPDSAGVIDHLLARPPENFRRLCLMGNHEVMLREFLRRPHPHSNWLDTGGRETLQSYGISSHGLQAARTSQLAMLIKAHVPDDHIEFLDGLAWTLQTPGWLFVHAGIRPGIPLHAQNPDDLFWIRDEFYNIVDQEERDQREFRVVHGHTPARDPVISPARICIDTGAYATGCLTALKITPDGRVETLQTSHSLGAN